MQVIKTTSFVFEDVMDLNDLRDVVIGTDLWPGSAEVDLTTGIVTVSYTEGDDE